MVNTPMELNQKIRFCAPDCTVSVLTVEPRRVPSSDLNFADAAGGDEQLPRVLEVRLIDNPIFSGVCKLELGQYVPPVEAIVELANCRRDSAAVQRFTRRYGPLLTATDGRFAFQLSDWCGMQSQFRWTWDGILGLADRFPSEVVPNLKKHAPQVFVGQVFAEPIKRVQASGRFEMTSSGLDFIAENLFAALLLVLIGVHERGKLRHCANPQCGEPYFIAAHPRQRYCTEKCAGWAQAEWKRIWWKESGKDWLKENAAKSTRKRPKQSPKERKSNGTHKTR